MRCELVYLLANLLDHRPEFAGLLLGSGLLPLVLEELDNEKEGGLVLNYLCLLNVLFV
jgi:hypothetical protein